MYVCMTVLHCSAFIQKITNYKIKKGELLNCCQLELLSMSISINLVVMRLVLLAMRINI